MLGLVGLYLVVLPGLEEMVPRLLLLLSGTPPLPLRRLSCLGLRRELLMPPVAAWGPGTWESVVLMEAVDLAESEEERMMLPLRVRKPTRGIVFWGVVRDWGPLEPNRLWCKAVMGVSGCEEGEAPSPPPVISL